MTAIVPPQTRSSISATDFLDQLNLRRQERHSSTPRRPGHPGHPVIIAQAVWIGTLALRQPTVYVISRTNLTPISRERYFSRGDDFFPEVTEPQRIDLDTYRRIRPLLTAPYTEIEFPPNES